MDWKLPLYSFKKILDRFPTKPYTEPIRTDSNRWGFSHVDFQR